MSYIAYHIEYIIYLISIIAYYISYAILIGYNKVERTDIQPDRQTNSCGYGVAQQLKMKGPNSDFCRFNAPFLVGRLGQVVVLN